MGRAATKAKPVAPPKPVIEVFDEVEQGTEEWKKLRIGICTASRFGVMLRNGDASTRTDLLNTMAGEILSGEPAETFQNGAMRRGQEMEPEAREHYARTNFAVIRRVGFVRRALPNGLVVGCSPDSLVGDDGALEIKTMAPSLLVAQMIRGTPPVAHRAQLHGTLWVTDREWIDLQLFYRGMPQAPKYRYVRDDVFIRELSDAVEVFDYELKQLVKRIRSMGGK